MCMKKVKFFVQKGLQLKPICKTHSIVCNISNLLNFGLKGFSFYLCILKSMHNELTQYSSNQTPR